MSLDFVIPKSIFNGDSSDKFIFYEKGFKLGSIDEVVHDIILSGHMSLTLHHAKANGFNYVKLYGGTRQCSLPKGYKQVASLESDGTASLATPFIVTNVAKVEGTVSFTKLATGSGIQYVVGGRISSAVSSTGVGYCLYTPARGGLTFYPMAWRDTSIGTNVTIGTQYAFSSKIVTGNQKLIVNNTEKAALTYTITKTSGTNTIALFALGTAGSQYTGDGVVLHDKILFYNDNDELLAYYVFVERESDNALGALNLLDGSFITNSAGTFTKGAYVTDTTYPVQVLPTPTNAVDITCNNGKLKLSPNIFKGTFEQFDNTGGSGSTYAYFKLPEENETYTLTVRCKKAFQGTSNTFLGFTNTGGTQSAVRWVISSGTSADVGKVISIDNGGTRNFVSLFNKTETALNKILDCFDIQLEKGSTATDYVPYGEVYADGTVETVTDSLNNSATAETLFSVAEEYTDTQEVLTGTVTRKCKVVVFNGTETWYAGTNGTCYTNIGIQGIPFDGLTAYCTHFTYDNTKHSTSTIVNNTFIFNQSVGQTGTNGSVTIKATDLFTTATAAKAWLAEQYANGTPVIMVVPIPTEKTETVAGQTLTTKAGTNHLTITQASLHNLGLQVSYKGTSH